jgi:hypothetical protein
VRRAEHADDGAHGDESAQHDVTQDEQLGGERIGDLHDVDDDADRGEVESTISQIFVDALRRVSSGARAATLK